MNILRSTYEGLAKRIYEVCANKVGIEQSDNRKRLVEAYQDLCVALAVDENPDDREFLEAIESVIESEDLLPAAAKVSKHIYFVENFTLDVEEEVYQLSEPEEVLPKAKERFIAHQESWETFQMLIENQKYKRAFVELAEIIANILSAGLLIHRRNVNTTDLEILYRRYSAVQKREVNLRTAELLKVLAKMQYEFIEGGYTMTEEEKEKLQEMLKKCYTVYSDIIEEAMKEVSVVMKDPNLLYA